MTSTSSHYIGAPMDIGLALRSSPPALDEVLPGLLAGTVGMLAGPGGVGKTMFELQLAIALAAGLADRDGLVSTWTAGKLKPKPQRVVLVAAEEPREVICHRLHAIVRTLNLQEVLPTGEPLQHAVELLTKNLVIYPIAGHVRLNLVGDDLRRTPHMDELQLACEGARLVIVDPLRQVHLHDENRSDAMSAVVSQFKGLAHATGAAVVFAHHTSRASDWQGMGDTAGAARGSTALGADVRWQLNLANLTKTQAHKYGLTSDEADRHVMLHHAKGNYGPKADSLLLERVGQGVLAPSKALASRKVPKSAGPRASHTAKSQPEDAT